VILFIELTKSGKNKQTYDA